MIAEIGHFALVLAFALALYQTVVPLYGAQARDAALMRTALPAAFSQLALIAVAFGALTWLYVTNSHSAKPLIYKISGVWGNHEGSMVLWVLILALFGAARGPVRAQSAADLQGAGAGRAGLIGVAFLLFILAPLQPLRAPRSGAVRGQGLNPILQDPALAFHPPFLYAGYVGSRSPSPSPSRR
jgi:cytochrome c-type biogenesis protein CcmF